MSVGIYIYTCIHDSHSQHYLDGAHTLSHHFVEIRILPLLTTSDLGSEELYNTIIIHCKVSEMKLDVDWQYSMQNGGF